MLDIDTIIQKRQPTNQYVNIVFPKNQLYIHHTASSPNPFEVITYWNSNQDAVGTAFIIAGKPSSNASFYKDGDIVQCFPSNRAAWHLGLTQKDLARGGSGHKTNQELNLQAVGIEMCNWGGLTKKDKGWTSYAGVVVPDEDVIEYPNGFRGYKAYQKYTTAQLESCRLLLGYLCDKYNIPKDYQGDAIFDIDPRALCGQKGIFTHVSVRPPSEKQDCHPQPELITMLKSI